MKLLKHSLIYYKTWQIPSTEFSSNSKLKALQIINSAFLVKFQTLFFSSNSQLCIGFDYHLDCRGPKSAKESHFFIYFLEILATLNFFL